MLHKLIGLLIGCVAIWADHVTASTTPSPTGIHLIDGLCMNNSRSDRLVYRHKNDTNIYIAFDVLKLGMVDIYSWKIIQVDKGTFISSMKARRELAVDFRKTVNRSHVIGACGKRQHKKFKKRLVRKNKQCKALFKKKRKHCKMTAVMSAFVRLKMRTVTFDNDECPMIF